ncbi:hypothetical protein FSP39_008355 [Pinctada imbricata]|uniref:Uncharacterized protein n=1 Tax=Pinctada imbricata TaxID=66713 RepID=A0AA89C5L6_PINIB|nr:hypothetical protein FSP39_008355 [Pinctada imbricata]
MSHLCPLPCGARKKVPREGFDTTKKPTLLTCQMTVHGDGGEMQYSPAIGTTECKNQQDFYGRFQIKSLTIKMVSEYEVSPTSKKPNFVASYTFGVTEAIVSVQRRNLTGILRTFT